MDLLTVCFWDRHGHIVGRKLELASSSVGLGVGSCSNIDGQRVFGVQHFSGSYAVELLSKVRNLLKRGLDWVEDIRTYSLS